MSLSASATDAVSGAATAPNEPSRLASTVEGSEAAGSEHVQSRAGSAAQDPTVSRVLPLPAGCRPTPQTKAFQTTWSAFVQSELAGLRDESDREWVTQVASPVARDARWEHYQLEKKYQALQRKSAKRTPEWRKAHQHFESTANARKSKGAQQESAELETEPRLPDKDFNPLLYTSARASEMFTGLPQTRQDILGRLLNKTSFSQTSVPASDSPLGMGENGAKTPVTGSLRWSIGEFQGSDGRVRHLNHVTPQIETLRLQYRDLWPFVLPRSPRYLATYRDKWSKEVKKEITDYEGRNSAWRDARTKELVKKLDGLRALIGDELPALTKALSGFTLDLKNKADSASSQPDVTAAVSNSTASQRKLAGPLRDATARLTTITKHLNSDDIQLRLGVANALSMVPTQVWALWEELGQYSNLAERTKLTAADSKLPEAVTEASSNVREFLGAVITYGIAPTSQEAHSDSQTASSSKAITNNAAADSAVMNRAPDIAHPQRTDGDTAVSYPWLTDGPLQQRADGRYTRKSCDQRSNLLHKLVSRIDGDMAFESSQPSVNASHHVNLSKHKIRESYRKNIEALATYDAQLIDFTTQYVADTWRDYSTGEAFKSRSS